MSIWCQDFDLCWCHFDVILMSCFVGIWCQFNMYLMSWWLITFWCYFDIIQYQALMSIQHLFDIKMSWCWCHFHVKFCWHLMSIQHLFDVKMSWCWCIGRQCFNAILLSFNIKLRCQFNINPKSNINDKSMNIYWQILI